MPLQGGNLLVAILKYFLEVINLSVYIFGQFRLFYVGGEEIMEKDARMSLICLFEHIWWNITLSTDMGFWQIVQFNKYVHRQVNYLQEIFQNGRQKWVSFFFWPPCRYDVSDVVWYYLFQTLLSFRSRFSWRNFNHMTINSMMNYVNSCYFGQVFYRQNSCFCVSR